jgi:NADH dehydrogenase
MFAAVSRGPLNVCVLGGTGFVGTELVTRLALEGHWVRVPTRNLSHAEPLRVLDTVRPILANVHDERVLGELFTGMDAVINLVGILNEHGRASFRSVHTELAAKVVAEARLARVRRLLHMSAVGADPERAPSQYLRSKGEAEARVRAAAPHLEFTIFRPSVIFGPGDSLTTRFAGLLRLAAGVLPLARPGARFAPIDVNDVADAFLAALRSRETVGKTYELCGPDVLTLEQIIRMTADVAGLPCHILRLPDFLGKLEARVMGLIPGKPFSMDNFLSLTIDSVCQDNGCVKLGLLPQHMLSVLPTYLGRHLHRRTA